LIRGPDASMVKHMDRRVAAGLAVGLAGLAAGVAAGLAGTPVLGLVAGACALAGAAVVLVLGAALGRRDHDLAVVHDGLAALHSEVSHLRNATDAGQEAIKVAGSFAEMVALRNRELVRQASTSLVDDATGLLDARYFQPALQSRVAAARRLLRPVSVVLLELEGPDDVGVFAGVLRQTLREADTACRVDDHRFALILEDTPEGGGVWAAERIRAGFAREGGPVQTLSAGVAAYPSHALEADDLLGRAERALERARASGRGQVEVAPVD
jgi:diguanylate cyclase (GGDEF)-like protein